MNRMTTRLVTPGVTVSSGNEVGRQQRHEERGTTSGHANEAMFMFSTAGIGFLFNMIVIISLLSSKSLRNTSGAFVIHGCLLDLLKCLYCLPFATSLLRDEVPGFCATLGGTYVLIVTASGFNIVAMICSEAYNFSENSTSPAGAYSSVDDSVRSSSSRAADDMSGGACCVLFGIAMVYIGSVIIHLGPTIIGGDFNFNDVIGNCIFVYGTVKSYIVHTMWIIIMTLAILSAVYYLSFYYRHLRASATHRIAALIRTALQAKASRSQDRRIQIDRNAENARIQEIVSNSMSRSRVLIVITLLFIVCWYPLYALTLCDPKFNQPKKIYKLLTFIAWSNAALDPLVLILFDQSTSRFRKLFSCFDLKSMKTGNGHRPCWTSLSKLRRNCSTAMLGRFGSMSTQSIELGVHAVSPEVAIYHFRVGCRLCHEGNNTTNVFAASTSADENVWIENGHLSNDDNASFCELHRYDF